MKILIVGNGGREHAIAWKLSQSPEVEQIFVAPGNGGTATLAKSENVTIGALELTALRDFAQQMQVDLTIVGPEAPLVAGIVDLFQEANLPIFGPTKAAAQLEGSKAFSKAFMLRHGIPTAQAECFDDADDAFRYLRGLDSVPVIKASGLAGGKGVILPDTKQEAAIILQKMLLERQFGEASDTVVIEERLRGPEISVLAFCDGENFSVMPVAQDHKRLLDGDHGPNTGGMGAFAPSPLATSALLARIENEVLRPTLVGMVAEGTPYVGVLYAGLMLTHQGPKVLEFNCRLGDPEAQVLLPLLNSDLAEICMACVEGRLDQVSTDYRDQAGVTVVMASPGYPVEYPTGVEITGIDKANNADCIVFQAGTKIYDDRLVTDGGRVLAVTALGDQFRQASRTAYLGITHIRFNNAFYRRDIGQRVAR